MTTCSRATLPAAETVMLCAKEKSKHRSPSGLTLRRGTPWAPLTGCADVADGALGLKRFTDTLTKFTRYSRLQVVASLKYGDMFNNSSIVSSIEFDRCAGGRLVAALSSTGLLTTVGSTGARSASAAGRDDEHFATAGVTKKIKVFNLANVVNDPVDVHFPVREMQCRSKIRSAGQRAPC